jgi:hypothetical protein
MLSARKSVIGSEAIQGAALECTRKTLLICSHEVFRPKRAPAGASRDSPSGSQLHRTYWNTHSKGAGRSVTLGYSREPPVATSFTRFERLSESVRSSAVLQVGSPYARHPNSICGCGRCSHPGTASGLAAAYRPFPCRLF